ncbi:MAG: hypothetical protein LAN59_08445 [Acidobacteriia bacterium]|nr:hypothetical protein [Terriglobia bacterium]
MSERARSPEQPLEEAVSRALRENLAPLQGTIDDLDTAFADLVAACSSSRPSNALPAMVRAQTAAAALAAGLSSLSNFVAFALKPRAHGVPQAVAAAAAPAVEEVEEPAAEEEPAWAEEPVAPAPVAARPTRPVAAPPPAAPAKPARPAPFNVATLSAELQDLHRRANRVAKVAMQDIKLLRPDDVQLGQEHKDICHRLRSDIDKARKEYDRRFQAIQEHPVDYFRSWMVEILAGGDVDALGEYPYPSPVPR